MLSRHPRVGLRIGEAPLFERFEKRIVDGERNGLDAGLDLALQEKTALRSSTRHCLRG